MKKIRFNLLKFLGLAFLFYKFLDLINDSKDDEKKEDINQNNEEKTTADEKSLNKEEEQNEEVKEIQDTTNGENNEIKEENNIEIEIKEMENKIPFVESHIAPESQNMNLKENNGFSNNHIVYNNVIKDVAKDATTKQNEVHVENSTTVVHGPSSLTVDDIFIEENKSIEIDVLNNDSKNEGSLRILDAEILNGSGVIKIVNNKIIYRPSILDDGLAAGETKEIEIEYSAINDFGFISSTKVTITIVGTDDEAILLNDVAYSRENEWIEVDVLNNDSDVDSLITLNAARIISGIGEVKVESGKLYFMSTDDGLAAGETKEIEIEYDVITFVGVRSANVTITVTGTNDAPTLTVENTKTINEDTTATINFIANDLDSNYTTTAVAGHGSVTVDDTTQTITYKPDVNYNGIDTIIITTVDDNGAEVTKQTNIVINAIDDVPVIESINTKTINEDTTTTIEFTATDVDSDLTYAAYADHGSVTIDGQTITYKPDANYNGSDTIVLEVTGDGQTTTKEIDITIVAIDDKAILTDDSATVDEDNSITLDVLNNDSDVDNALTLESAAIVSGNGSVNIVDNKLVYNTDNSYDYLQDGETATTTVDYVANGETANVTITVTGTNDAPTLEIPPSSTTEETIITGYFTATDVDNSDLTFSLVNEVPGLTVNSDGSWVLDTNIEDYTSLTYNETKSVSATISVSDGNISVTKDFDITVVGVNHAPTTTPFDLGELYVDQAVTFSEEDILSLASDIDGDTISLIDVTVDPSIGNIINNDDGTYTFTPSSTTTGSYFTITYSDGIDTTESTTTTFSVVEQNIITPLITLITPGEFIEGIATANTALDITVDDTVIGQTTTDDTGYFIYDDDLSQYGNNTKIQIVDNNNNLNSGYSVYQNGITTLDGGDYVDYQVGTTDRDNFYGSAGADYMDGIDIDNFNKLYYTLSPEGVNINTITNVNTGGDAEGDQIFNIRLFYGSKFNDNIETDINNAFINADDGDDVIISNNGTVQGGDGNDNITMNSGTAYGDAGDDIINSDSGNVYGGDGNDILSGKTGYVHGDTGDDYILYSVDTSGIYGDDGQDTLFFSDNENINFGALDDITITKMEQIDLNINGDHGIKLTLQDVLDFTANNESNDVLTILGDNNDSVTLKNSEFSYSSNDGSYDYYVSNDNSVTLKIDDDLSMYML